MYKALVAYLFEKKIKILRSDNSGEFTESDFKNLCIEVGIKRELSTPYTPQQNGVVESKNRSIMEAMKTMLDDQDIPKYLWVKATRTTVYVQNRRPHRVIDNQTPEVVFLGEIIEVSHLRILLTTFLD